MNLIRSLWKTRRGYSKGATIRNIPFLSIPDESERERKRGQSSKAIVENSICHAHLNPS